MQKLRLPIDDFKPTAGYKNTKYKSHWGYTHYGVDCISFMKKTPLYALGNGTVKLAGLDGLYGRTTGEGSGCGYVLVIVYDQCENNKTGKATNLTVTYMHMKSMPFVKVGDKVTVKTLLGYYGNTGAKTSGAHLHFQMDKDTVFFKNCCGLSSKGHNLLKKGVIDSTVNPVDYLWVYENQIVNAPSSVWYDRDQFLKIPKIKVEKEPPKQNINMVTGSGPIILGGKR